jgi:glycerol-3-phosphate dehydrogenase
MTASAKTGDAIDLLVIGGGINGAGIARDAAGRGLRVMLVEQDDLASHTSSASTKLIHGGLRYLEQYEFRLVRESLIERERLLALAPHIIRPLTFVLPHCEGMRPAWLVRLGLFLYDHLGGRKTLPASFGVRLRGSIYGKGLDPSITRGFVYSDCWVDDARLVVLNAIDAALYGADIRTGTRLIAARREGSEWIATLLDRISGRETEVRAKAIVNAAGPWVCEVLRSIDDLAESRPPRLVKGSHIIVPRRLEGDHAFIFQNSDKRVLFAIPYEQDFTLIGTTDIPWTGDPSSPHIDAEEIAYLCAGVNRYLAHPIAPEDIVHSYSGIRSLYDDGSDRASEITRDYMLDLDRSDGAPLLSVFGGKITTYRRLSEQVLEKLAPFLPAMAPEWTATHPLPGGDIPGGDFQSFEAEVRARWPFLPPATALRLSRAYGTRLDRVMGDARSLAQMGEDFGGGLSASEVDYLIEHEWARTAEDIMWRRSKLGLHLEPESIARLSAYLANKAKLPEQAHG